MMPMLRSAANPGLYRRWSLLLNSSMLQAEDSDGATSVQEFMLMAQKASWSFGNGFIPLRDLVAPLRVECPWGAAVPIRLAKV